MVSHTTLFCSPQGTSLTRPYHASCTVAVSTAEVISPHCSRYKGIHSSWYTWDLRLICKRSPSAQSVMLVSCKDSISSGLGIFVGSQIRVVVWISTLFQATVQVCVYVV